MKKEPQFATEADLCATFLAWVHACSGKVKRGERCPVWTPYAETAGWDILLVAEDGTQIGIQAKLKFNMKVLAQTVPDSWAVWHQRGPDYRAVLVPERDSTHLNICTALGLILFTPDGRPWGLDPVQEFSPDLGSPGSTWHWWSPEKREKLPAYVPDVVAGAAGPVQLTEWKVKALRMVALLEVQGTVNRTDFRNNHLDSRRWTGPGGWLIPTDKPGVYARGPGLDFDKQHPQVYQQVLAEVKAAHVAVPKPEVPAAPALAAAQGELL